LGTDARPDIEVGGWQFVKLGALVMLPALILALAALAI
jgi:Na+/H+ antiporter NhaD/arsenite permease-like protein